MNFTDKEIFHDHTKQLIDILKGQKNPKIVTARNPFERKIIYEFCETNGWDREKIGTEDHWKGEWFFCDYNPPCCDGYSRSYRVEYTTFKLSRKLQWTRGIVRQPLEAAGLCSDVVIHHVYPYLNDLFKNELTIE